MEQDFTPNKLAEVYIKIRNTIREKEKAHEEEMAALKEQFELVGERLLAVCNVQDADSIKTPSGTIMRRVTSRYWTSDWESMYKFIMENNAPYLLTQGINNSNMAQFLQEHPDKLPMGLQNERKFAVSVRKPSAK